MTAAVALPVSLFAAISAGCGGPAKEPATGGGASSASTSASSTMTSTTTTATTPPGADAGVAMADAATSSGYWPAPDAAVATPADAGPPPACWFGFKSTGNPVADVNDLGARCAKGMAQIIPPVKQSFAQGEKKQIPLIIPGPGCYRIIAVGGTGVKDVDLEVRDSSGKLVAADDTPDDIFPMIHPNKEWCPDAAQFLTLSIIVKKGSGDVAGGVWKR